MDISVVLLIHNSEVNKGFYLQHCLYSLLLQNFHNFEVIVINNNDQENEKILNLLNEISEFINKFKLLISINYVYTKSKLTRGNARNIGASFARSDLLVFIDDDIILPDNLSLKKIFEVSEIHPWGMGAKRHWTHDDWFNRNLENILKQIKRCDFRNLINHSELPQKFVCGNEDVTAELVSFIGHFGYCKKKLFVTAGGFPDFEYDLFEDDFLTLKLYKASGKPFILSDIDIIHIKHTLVSNKIKADTFYFSKLVEKDIFDFDCLGLIFGEDKPIKTLQSLHYCEEVVTTYLKYKNYLPLNSYSIDTTGIRNWYSKFQLDIFNFVILIHRLMNSKSVDEFLQNNPVDFDNIAPLIKSAIETKMVSINKKSQITSNSTFEHHQLNIYDRKVEILTVPNPESNQFPCTLQSRQKRLNFIKSRFPFCEFLRISIIGDDDLLSAELINEFWIYPVIYDSDKMIMKTVQQFSNRFIAKQIDFCNLLYEGNEILTGIPKSYTFITDPPYTLNGILLFIFSGLLTLDLSKKSMREFYVIINPSIIGKNIYSLLKILSQCNIFLYETVKNFNNYDLPFHYQEFERAENFSSENFLNTPKTSSTSNLYIFNTEKPRINRLRKVINTSLIYEHYH